MSNNKVVIIDADGLPYRAAYIAETRGMTYEEACGLLDNMFRTIVENCGTDKYIAFVSGRNNFRKQLRADYKEARLKNKHLQQVGFFEPLKLYMTLYWKCIIVDGIEADDACGIMSTRFKGNCIIASDDLDLLQLEGTHYKLTKKEFIEVDNPFGTLYIEEKYSTTNLGGIKKTKKLRGTGQLLFWSMMLTGDKDECEGLEGYGNIKAYNSLIHCKNERELQEAVYKAYCEVYPSSEAKDKFLTNYQLLHVIRDNNTFTTPEIMTLPDLLEEE